MNQNSLTCVQLLLSQISRLCFGQAHQLFKNLSNKPTFLFFCCTPKRVYFGKSWQTMLDNR